MEVKVSILNDNLAGPPTFMAEHGLSLLVEIDGRSFLWDCGSTDITIKNARRMGIDLRSIEGIGLSHGHYDHCGGLLSVLEVAGPKPVYVHPGAFVPRYAVTGGSRRFIGIPFCREQVESSCSSLELSSGPIEVMPGVVMSGEIPRVTEFEGCETNLFSVQDGVMANDTFPDDQSLLVKTPDGVIVVTGCAHAGLVNILKHVVERYGDIRAVIGGTHLGLGDGKRLQPTIDYLDEVLPEKMIFNHCTGIPSAMAMKQHFGDRFIMGETGMTVRF